MNKKQISIKVKKATIKDIEMFWNLFRSSVKNLFPEYSVSVKAINEIFRKRFSKNVFRQRIQEKNLIVLIASRGKNPAGFLVANLPSGGMSLVIWLAVIANFQKIGIGSLLLRKYERIAKKQEIHKINLWTYKRNLSFYKKNGYKLAGFIPKAYYGVDGYILYKSIQRSKY
jgi:GNAT superfamily N-acetyltransferase